MDKIRKTIGKEVARLPVNEQNTRNSEGAFLRLKDGSILYAYSHYGCEGADDSASDIGCILSYDEGETWGERRILYAHRERENLMCPSLIRMHNGDLGLFYLYRVRAGAAGQVLLVRSADEGQTWSEPVVCTVNSPNQNFVVENGHVIMLESGRILVPAAYHQRDNDGYAKRLNSFGANSFFYSDDDGRTWTEAADRYIGPPAEWCSSGMQEPMAFQDKTGRIRTFSRTDVGCQYESDSFDNGVTWTTPQPNIRFASPCSPMVMKRAGDFVLATLNPTPPHYNDDLEWLQNKREPLVCLVSDNDGASFDKIYAIDYDIGCCYPDIFDGGDYALVGYQSFNDGVIVKIDLNEFRDLILAKDGRSDYAVVCGANASPSERHAAEELVSYFEKITGARLPIRTDKEGEPSEKEFVVGRTDREGESEFDRAELGDDGFVIKTKGDRIFLVGGEKRGTLYSVYSFLEQYLGCRFFTDTFERIPYDPNLKISPIAEDKQIPVFKTRDLFWQSLRSQDARVKLKLNGNERRDMPEEKGGAVTYVDDLFCHTLRVLAGLESKSNEDPTPCLSDETVYQTVLSNVRKAIRKDPKGRILSVTQMDNLNHCTCPACKAKDEAEQSCQGSLLPFVNRLADDIKAEAPDVMIDTFAYYYTLDVPKTLQANDNVIVRLCSILSCFSHPLNDCGVEFYEVENNRVFAENLRAWSKHCRNINIWDYTTNFHHYLAPFPNFNVLRPNLKYMADHNVTGVFEQGAGNNSLGGEFGELRAYLIAKLLWDPYMPEETYRKHMRDFLLNYYGTAGHYLQQYIEFMQEQVKDVHFNIFSDTLEVIPPKYIKNEHPLPPPTEITADVDWLAYADNENFIDWSYIEKGNKIFDIAMAYAWGEEEKERVRSSRIHLLYYETILTFHRYGARMIEQIKKVVPEAEWDKALAFAAEQKNAAVTAINQRLRDEIIHFGIERLAEDCEYHPDWACNLRNEPIDYWREEDYTRR